MAADDKPKTKSKPAGHTATAAPLIGAMSFLLAAGLERLGLLRGADAFTRGMLTRDGEGFPNVMPQLWLWCGTAALAVFLPFAMLATPAQWRRLLLWLLSLVLVAGWAPVLALAAYDPKISVPWIATFWAGFCSFYYAGHHRMPADAKQGGRR
ncbi:MAG: hypothetical protein V4733_08875 [Verrucomicrobiota bacterium]